MLNLRRLDSRQPGMPDELQALRDRLSPRGDVVSEASRERTVAVFGQPLTPRQVVETICERVAREGLPAVLEYSRLLDRADLTAASVRVSADELRQAHRQADADFLRTVRGISERIREFQLAILHQETVVEPAPGVRLVQRYVPLQRVGICVPGGAAAYPSTVLMTAIPAQVAGVEQIAVVAPPTRFGANNPDILATCWELGIDEVYRIGGAQGVAALAYGVEGIPAVDKIVGPGNLFVALAKQYVFGRVAIDAIAGPSEVVVIADPGAPADFVAADLLAQAEHSPGASLLISWSDQLLDQVAQELERQVAELERAELTVESLQQFGALIRVEDQREACRVADMIAPEHLHLAVEEPFRLLDSIRNAGAIFMGYYSPVALGDYVAGPSHVLPTSGTARWASGLSSNEFLRAGSVIHYSPDALRSAAADVAMMAERESLTAHRRSVQIRADALAEDRRR